MGNTRKPLDELHTTPASLWDYILPTGERCCIRRPLSAEKHLIEEIRCFFLAKIFLDNLLMSGYSIYS